MKIIPENPQTYPVVIIGGGLAGSAAGAALARSGWKVAIIERDTFPRDKLCGEFLSGESRRLLSQIGCLQDLLQHDPPEIASVRIVPSSGRDLRVQLPEPALGISRRVLDETLFNHACACGADGFTGCEVRELQKTEDASRSLHVRQQMGREVLLRDLSPKLIINAYGRRGKLDHDLQRAFLTRVQASTGFKMHHRIAAGLAGQEAFRELAGVTEIYGLDGGYCGVNLVEQGLVNVCMLLQPRALKHVKSGQWKDIVIFLTRANTALGRRLTGLVPVTDRALSVSGMPFVSKEQATDNCLFIGDAAGMITPFCGDGQAMALESGVRLATMLIRKYDATAPGFSSADISIGELSREWSRDWERQFGLRLKVGNALQSALFRPGLSSVAISVLRHTPGVASYLAAITRSRSSRRIGSLTAE